MAEQSKAACRHGDPDNSGQCIYCGVALEDQKAASICECGHERAAHLRERLVCYADEGNCGCVEYRDASTAITRDELSGLCVMVYDAAGNAVEVFDWTPEALEEAARRLRRWLGEATTVTYGPSSFIQGAA